MEPMMGESDKDQIMEESPDGRFVRFANKLGHGAFKVVYHGIDRDRGVEIAWNQLMLDRYEVDFRKVKQEVELLEQLKHPRIIEFISCWLDEKQKMLIFITECMTSGTLRSFLKKAKSVKLKVIKNWCKQILDGLNYLHTRDPPIIHRDIKCDNIFINGSVGEVKIGDFGLATVWRRSGAQLSVIGTPEFMAPEFYDESYTVKVDIWAFGCALIEMVTLDYPYSECENPAQIFKKVSSGKLPSQIELIKDESIKEFIKLCLSPPEKRPTAMELLQHPFLKSENVDQDATVLDVVTGSHTAGPQKVEYTVNVESGVGGKTVPSQIASNIVQGGGSSSPPRQPTSPSGSVIIPTISANFPVSEPTIPPAPSSPRNVERLKRESQNNTLGTTPRHSRKVSDTGSLSGRSDSLNNDDLSSEDEIAIPLNAQSDDTEEYAQLLDEQASTPPTSQLKVTLAMADAKITEDNTNTNTNTNTELKLLKKSSSSSSNESTGPSNSANGEDTDIARRVRAMEEEHEKQRKDLEMKHLLEKMQLEKIREQSHQSMKAWLDSSSAPTPIPQFSSDDDKSKNFQRTISQEFLKSSSGNIPVKSNIDLLSLTALEEFGKEATTRQQGTSLPATASYHTHQSYSATVIPASYGSNPASTTTSSSAATTSFSHPTITTKPIN